MTILERVQQWLQTYPGWEDSLTVDMLPAGPGHMGLFPTGMKELSRTEDILGNQQVAYRLGFTLRRQVGVEEDNASHAAWLLDFQDWVRQQSQAGLAPRLGDVPAREKMWAEKGSLQKISPTGIGTYTVTLIANFTKLYEVN